MTGLSYGVTKALRAPLRRCPTRCIGDQHAQASTMHQHRRLAIRVVSRSSSHAPITRHEVDDRSVSHNDADEMYVWVIMFREKECTGLYSLRAMPFSNESIVAFEIWEDAFRFISLLKLTSDYDISAHHIHTGELFQFCLENGYSWRIESKGSRLVPPAFRVRVTEWERALRLMRGELEVLPSARPVSDWSGHEHRPSEDDRAKWDPSVQGQGEEIDTKASDCEPDAAAGLWMTPAESAAMLERCWLLEE